MFLLCSYDISSSPKRLQKIAQICKNYGVRVQSSVFELDVNLAELKKLQMEVKKAIDPEKDSIRFYKLGKSYREHVEIIGAREHIELSKDDAIMF